MLDIKTQREIEIMKEGGALLARALGEVVKAVHDGVTGFLVEQKDIVGIQAALVRLLRDPVLAQKLGEAGRRRVEEEFQLKRQAEKLQYLLSL